MWLYVYYDVLCVYVLLVCCWCLGGSNKMLIDAIDPEAPGFASQLSRLLRRRCRGASLPSFRRLDLLSLARRAWSCRGARGGVGRSLWSPIPHLLFWSADTWEGRVQRRANSSKGRMDYLPIRTTGICGFSQGPIVESHKGSLMSTTPRASERPERARGAAHFGTQGGQNDRMRGCDVLAATPRRETSSVHSR